MLETLCPLPLTPAFLDKSFLTSDLTNLNCSHISYNPCNDNAVLECSGLYYIYAGIFVVSLGFELQIDDYNKPYLNHHSALAKTKHIFPSKNKLIYCDQPDSNVKIISLQGLTVVEIDKSAEADSMSPKYRVQKYPIFME